MSDTSALFDQHWDRGFELYRQDKLEEAIAEWREASRIDPEDGYPLNLIGGALSQLGREQEAIAEWREAVRLEPDHEEANDNLAYALSQAGRRDEAIHVSREARRHCPESVILLSRLASVLMAGTDEKSVLATLPEAVEALRQSVAIEPQASTSLQLLGLAQWWMGHRLEGIRLLKASIAADPSNASAYLDLIAFQLRALHWNSMTETVTKLGKIAKPKEINEYYARCWRIAHRLNTLLGFITGFGVVFLWIRKRRG